MPTIFVEVRDPAKPWGLVDAVPIVNAVDDVDAEDAEGVRICACVCVCVCVWAGGGGGACVLACVRASVRVCVGVFVHATVLAHGYGWVILYQQQSLYEVDAESSGDEAGTLARTGSGTPTVNGERASLLQDGRVESKGEHGKRMTGRFILAIEPRLHCTNGSA